ncbi:MAG: hypothetical protein R3Y26_03810 [Rikenellaceae bacterium]
MLNRECLDSYKDYLERLLESDSDDVFMNSGVEHVNVLLSTLFDNTHKTVRMFSNGLELKGVCGKEEYEKSLKCLIGSDDLEFVKVMLVSQPNDDNRIYKLLKESDKVEIKIITPEVQKYLSSNLKYKECNFSVYDDKMFRLEYEPLEYKAAGSFNFPKMANALSGIFDEAFKQLS